MLRYILILSLTFCFSLLAHAQIQPTASENILKTELMLQVLGDSIIKGSNDLIREAAISEFNARFFDLLAEPSTFNYPFDSLKTISKVKSADGRVRIYSWIQQSRTTGKYKYFGVVQRLDLKTGKMKLIGLLELKSATVEAESIEFKADTWFGAVYYDIIEKKSGKNTYYYLLGWHGNDRLTNKKVIDVLFFDLWDNITFGAPVFLDENKKLKYRVVFEFSAQAVMLLRYEKKKKMIVFDHLSPTSPSAKGQFQYYGPDFTYDGFYFKKGIWNYRKNLDLRN